MNSTNRGLNRLGIFLFGFVLLVIGVAAVAAAVVPTWLDAWASVAADVRKNSIGFITGPWFGPFAHTGALIVIPLICAILIALLLWSIFRQGHGRTRTLLVETATPTGNKKPTGGSVLIDSAVAEQSIQHVLDDHPGLVSSSLTAYKVRGIAVLKITVTVHRGVSPHQIRGFLDDTVAAWDGVLGREIPVVLQINAGMVSRVRKPTRLLLQQPQPAEA